MVIGLWPPDANIAKFVDLHDCDRGVYVDILVVNPLCLSLSSALIRPTIQDHGHFVLFFRTEDIAGRNKTGSSSHSEGLLDAELHGDGLHISSSPGQVADSFRRAPLFRRLVLRWAEKPTE